MTDDLYLGLDEKIASCGILSQLLQATGSLCRRPYECDTCGVFQARESNLPIDSAILWACFRCLDGRPDERIAQGDLLGYYKSGRCSWCGSDSIVLNAVVHGG